MKKPRRGLGRCAGAKVWKRDMLANSQPPQIITSASNTTRVASSQARATPVGCRVAGSAALSCGILEVWETKARASHYRGRVSCCDALLPHWQKITSLESIPFISVGKGEFEEAYLMPGDPKECRQHALNCVRLAQTAITPQSRDHFASLARTWINLADDLERSQAFLAELEDETEPKRRTG
jgi:hypothetical protein